jgi:hypothetical protein
MVIYMSSYDKWSRSYDILNIDQAAEISGLGRFECSEKSAIVTPIQLPSRWTFHTNIISNYLSFPMATYAPQSN